MKGERKRKRKKREVEGDRRLGVGEERDERCEEECRTSQIANERRTEVDASLHTTGRTRVIDGRVR